jgi:hypothetical protein
MIYWANGRKLESSEKQDYRGLMDAAGVIITFLFCVAAFVLAAVLLS